MIDLRPVKKKNQTSKMKTHLSILFVLCTLVALAQPPVNDDCAGIIDLGVAPVCSETDIYVNVDATPSDIGNQNTPDCWVGTPQRDVWFSFISSDTIIDYTISVIGCPDPVSGALPIVNPEVAIYRGDFCAFDELFLLDCASSSFDPGTNEIKFDPPPLTPGIRYFVRVNDWTSTSVGNAGGFKMCVEPQSPVLNVDAGGSDACSGEIFDTGGPTANYSNNEDHTFTICPSAAHSCLKFTLEFYELEEEVDQLIFYDGPDVNAPQIEIIGATNPFAENGVTGGGGTCIELTATSGCLTLNFSSNTTITGSGFHGFWECFQDPCEIDEPITMDGIVDDQTIIDNIATSQMTVTIDTIICNEGQYGVFGGVNTNLGMEKGLLLTTGSIANAIGPNFGFNVDENQGAPGDHDLDSLSAADNPSLDACVVEVDVFVPTDELTFEYIFASEEYAEYANSIFNDIFAFLVSGPGITGEPSLGGQENIALIPGTDIPVEINSINHVNNWQYYRSNEVDESNPLTPGGKSIKYDGMTTDYLGIKKTLTARKKVTPCETYHLKLAIGDRVDNAFDSGVFISEIQGGTPTLATNYFSGIDYLVEECTVVPDQIIVAIPLPESDVTFYEVLIGGTATLGVDYTLDMPDTISFAPGETQYVFPISPITDGITEGVETIEISLTRDFGCGQFIYSTLVIELRDELFVDILSGQDSAFVCEGGGAVQLNANGANQYAWTPSAIFDDNTISDPLATPLASGYIRVDGFLGICNDRDSIWLEITDPELELNVFGDTTFCEGGSVVLNASNNVSNTNLDWTPSIGIDNPDLPNVVAAPTENTTYVASVSLLGCSASDSVTIQVDAFDFPMVIADDTICQNSSIPLANNIVVTNTNYLWTPDINLDPGPSVSGPVASPDVNTTYTLLATSDRGYCDQSQSVSITVLPANVEIVEPDSVYICRGESIVINSESTTDGVGQTWTPNLNLTVIDNETIEVSPQVTTTYLATLEVGECTVFDSITVVVDSLPDLSLQVIPNKEEYCIGDTITILSSPYDNLNYPFIDFDWMPVAGSVTPTTNPILVTVVGGNTTYTRAVNNRECLGYSEISIEVAEDFSLLPIPAQSICPGDDAELLVQSDGTMIEVVWVDQDGNTVGSGNPILVSPDNTTTYEAIAAGPGNCFINTTAAQVSIFDPTIVTEVQVVAENGTVVAPTEIFENENITLQVNTNPTLANATYEWLLDGTVFQTTNTPMTSVFAAPSVEEEQTVEFEVQITDDNGCAAMGVISVLIQPNKEVALPNVFTPNSDNTNDYFTFVGGSATNPPVIIEFKVYNRWGQLVYDNENPSQGWDGKQNGEDAPADVYIYRVIYQLSANDPEITKSGEITLLR